MDWPVDTAWAVSQSDHQPQWIQHGPSLSQTTSLSGYSMGRLSVRPPASVDTAWAVSQSDHQPQWIQHGPSLSQTTSLWHTPHPAITPAGNKKDIRSPDDICCRWLTGDDLCIAVDGHQPVYSVARYIYLLT